MSSSLRRVLRNAWRMGPKNMLKNLNRIGDTKTGTLIGVDVTGNKFFENTTENEIHMRTRWVEYKDYYPNMTSVEPSWHAWLNHMIQDPPPKRPAANAAHRAYPTPKVVPSATGTTSAYIPYSTVKHRVQSWTWEPQVRERSRAIEEEVKV